MTPICLDQVASSWASYISSVPYSRKEDIKYHVPGTHSVYVMAFTLITGTGTFEFYYIGNTARPTKRPSEHVSEFLRCSVKTSHGKSKLYDPKYCTGLIAIEFSFCVLFSGYSTAREAEIQAEISAREWALEHTQEFMLSNQGRVRGKSRHRFKRTSAEIVV